MTAQRILLLSAYNAHSHQYWQQQLVVNFPQHHWQCLNLKDRYFAWRMGGNALNFKAAFHDLLSANYDLIIATSMTDLSTLRGLYPNLSSVPNILYFHENQFAYPTNENQQGLVEIQLRSVFAALAADQLVFNSTFNQHSFFQGLKQLIKKLPDGIPTNLLTKLKAKSTTLAVPINADCHPAVATPKSERDHIHVVWNHRWEHDKGPETLLEVLRLCQHKKIKFHIMGQQFRQIPAAMQQIKDQHHLQCLTLGFVESRSQYIELLQRSDVVLSTAMHDFQGIAMLEAVACGCLPIAPDRLVYPDLYPASNLYPSTPSSPAQEAQAIIKLLEQHTNLKPVKIDCLWLNLEAQYKQLLAVNHANNV
ncbi:MAG: tRNA-queuosine alpha-mannosyltransferase domain-containing protein [Marinicella sp.]